MITRNAAATKRTGIGNMIGATTVLLLVTLALAPAVARLQRSAGEAQCQSNLRRWSQAMALYCSDNAGRYPTNRPISAGVVGPITNNVALTADGQTDADGNPMRFASSINWVEALYPYLWASAKRTGVEWQSFRACPKATTRTPMSLSPVSTAYMSYTFNFYLVEQPSSFAQEPNKLLMLRELDCRANSLLRPSVPSQTGAAPANPFLNNFDSAISIFAPTTGKIHDQGSYIAFADGHVRHFPIEYYPKATEGIQFDSVSGRWYNFVTTGSPTVFKTIAITP